MPVQTMSDHCELEHATQVTQDVCNHLDCAQQFEQLINEPTRSVSPACLTSCNVATCSDAPNGEEHLDWNALPNSKQSSILQVDPLPLDAFTVIENTSIHIDDHLVERYNQLDNSIYNSVNNDDVQFANFTSTTTSMEIENFANFESSTWDTENNSRSCINDDFDDEEFADFKSASNDKAPSQVIQSNQLDQDKDLSALFKATFSSVSIHDSANLQTCDTSSDTFSFSSSQAQLLWTNLQEMDLKSICIHNWRESLSFKRLLQALKIDKNIIQHDLYTAYSSNRILEPIVNSNWNLDSIDKTNSTEFSDKIKANEPNSLSEGEFPPVFSLNQDLDFFESKYSYKNNTPNAKDDLIAEFENIILDNNAFLDSENELSRQISSPPAPASPANDLRKMLKDSIAKSNNEQVLSAETLQILNELPNLSFVRAKVLMFPINEKDS